MVHREGLAVWSGLTTVALSKCSDSWTNFTNLHARPTVVRSQPKVDFSKRNSLAADGKEQNKHKIEESVKRNAPALLDLSRSATDVSAADPGLHRKCPTSRTPGSGELSGFLHIHSSSNGVARSASG